MPSTSRLAEHPEANVAALAFLLNFPWEIWQMPLYRCLEMFAMSYGEAVAFLTAASIGDAVLSVVAFWCVAAAARSRAWIIDPTHGEACGFVGIGLAVTVFVEWIATRVLNVWQYTEAMPTLPLLDTGITPLLQWILLPPLVLWTVRRQLTGEAGRGGALGLARVRCRCNPCACDGHPYASRSTEREEA